MRFWQLKSIAREQPHLMVEVASQSRDWQHYAQSASDYSSLVQEQRRDVLDQLVDPAFMEAVLSKVTRVLYLDGGILRSHPTPADQQISALDAVSRFGATAVEDALEYGSVTVQG